MNIECGKCLTHCEGNFLIPEVKSLEGEGESCAGILFDGKETVQWQHYFVLGSQSVWATFPT